MAIALLFPGQGSQTPGMGQDFLASPLAKQLFEEANQALGMDLKKLCLEGPAEELTLTYHAQPAILTVSTIAHRLFVEATGIKPAYGAGHSLGEYSALVAAGVLDFAQAVKAVYLRGKAMQEAVPVGQGAMAAILGMEAEEIEALCLAEAGNQVVSPANFNCKGQIVISGHEEAVKRVLSKAKGKLLEVSAPFHCALMQPAAERLAAHFAEVTFHDAAFPIVNNARNLVLTKAADFKASLVEQVTAPVRWETGILKMTSAGVTNFVELGQGKVLAGMMKRIDKSAGMFNITSLADIQAQAEQIKALA